MKFIRYQEETGQWDILSFLMYKKQGARSFNFTFIGEEGESESEDEAPFTGEDEGSDEVEFEVVVEML